jgi:antitoxin component YwqK of YwqJK toxin-antitoxin module
MHPLIPNSYRVPLRWARVLFLSLAAGTLGCGSQQKKSDTLTNGSKSSKSESGAKLDRSRCDEKGKQVVTLDANGDGKPDVIKLFITSSQDGNQVNQLVCKQTDLDFDGKMDLIQYYGPNGDVFMDEYSMNYNGKFNGRSFFQDNRKVRAEKDMDFDGKMDYFEYYEGGKIVRVERDKNGDGRIDEWQYFENGRLDRIGYDTTGSGRVDKWERNTEGGLEAVPTPREATPAPAAPANPAAAADAAAAAAAADAASRGVGTTTAKTPPKKK